MIGMIPTSTTANMRLLSRFFSVACGTFTHQKSPYAGEIIVIVSPRTKTVPSLRFISPL